ncbi:MAG: HhH-GPD-type base excision DNA repair protein [Candidatus Nanopelagicales bacterium]
MSHTLTLAQDPDADALLSDDPFALLVGMLLDQQFPMEQAFAGRLCWRPGWSTPGRLDPATVLAADEATLLAAAKGPPAVHRYPGSMVSRVAALAQIVVDEAAPATPRPLWAEGTGQIRARLKALPGFGDQKSKIFLALLAKQLDVKPVGWQKACAPYGNKGTTMSIADVTGPDSLLKVREWKQAQKAKGEVLTQ